MKSYKPDLNEKLTIRLSVASKSELNAICERSDLDESLIARTALEAGMQLVKEHGISALIEKRQQLIASKLPAKPSKKKSDEAAIRIVKDSVGSGWSIQDKSGTALASGPLYSMRPKAKKLCPADGFVEILRPDGSRERVS